MAEPRGTPKADKTEKHWTAASVDWKDQSSAPQWADLRDLMLAVLTAGQSAEMRVALLAARSAVRLARQRADEMVVLRVGRRAEQTADSWDAM